MEIREIVHRFIFSEREYREHFGLTTVPTLQDISRRGFLVERVMSPSLPDEPYQAVHLPSGTRLTVRGWRLPRSGRPIV